MSFPTADLTLKVIKALALLVFTLKVQPSLATVVKGERTFTTVQMFHWSVAKSVIGPFKNSVCTYVNSAEGRGCHFEALDTDIFSSHKMGRANFSTSTLPSAREQFTIPGLFDPGQSAVPPSKGAN